MTQYAKVIDDTIVNIRNRPPGSARALDDGRWICPAGGLVNGTTAEQEACGWFVVVDVARPADTATTTFSRSVDLVSTVPTVVWTERAKTVDELADETRDTNNGDIETKLRNDIVTLKQQIVDLQADIDALQLLIDATDADIADAQAVIDHSGGNVASAHAEIVKLGQLVKGLVQADRTIERQLKNLKRDVLQQARGDNRLTRIVIGSDLLDDTDGT